MAQPRSRDERAKQLLQSRQLAYQRVFAGAASPADVKIFMADLARFCRADESTFHPDPRVAANLDGRREVWLRVQEHLNLGPDELWERHRPR